MVKICSQLEYSNNEKYKESFEKYPYKLSIFQKYALESIIEGNHVLVTAHTGSGKTMPAEFAIEHFISKGKKVIYTGPIKALINEKYYNFVQKFPHISFGLITGDIKSNPEAQVLLMTAEILLNKLYQIKSKNTVIASSTSFDLDIETELGCVIMDEVHFINNQDRGHVWENTIMLLPSHIQMVMLSATIDKPEKLAKWVEELDKEGIPRKQVYLTGTTERIVPLTHYSFITTPSGIFKAIKDKTVHAEINSIINKPIVVQSAKGEFQEANYHKVNKMLTLFGKHDVRVKRQHVLNEVTKYMVEKEMYPALFFVLSRKQLEVCANEITTNLLEFDSKVPYIIDRECEQIIRKMPNFEEYLHLPEYLRMVQLLRKGIAIHHGGMLPILKEMVELLFARGYIKILLATETFAVGINAPIKTVVFTSVSKYDGAEDRILYGAEYGQMSGRAGRRGIDTVGHVIHLNNLFRNIDSVSYRNMMKGTPQTLTSKFKISYNLLLNMIDMDDHNFLQFANHSMIKGELDSESNEYQQQILKIEGELAVLQNTMQCLKTPQSTIKEYLDLQKEKPQSVNKRRKEVDKRIQNIMDEYKFIDSDKIMFSKMVEKQDALLENQYRANSIQKYIKSNISTLLSFLSSQKFIENVEERTNKEYREDAEAESSYKLLARGSIAVHLKEVNCLVFAQMIEEKAFEPMTPKQLVAIFSCFTNVSIQEDYKEIVPNSVDPMVQIVVKQMKTLYDDYYEQESRFKIDTGTDYNIHFDLLNYIVAWCDCHDESECKFFLQNLEKEKDIFLGEFVKALLKITNICSELERVAEMQNNLEFLSKLKEIPSMLLKYVVTNQSLYV